MRRSVRASLAMLVAIVLAASVVGPSLARSAPPTLVASIQSVTCNPGGQPGLEVTAHATVTGSTLRSAELWLGELDTVSDPAYVPFPWTGVNTANWFSRDTYATTTSVTSETRTLRTTDSTTWNSANNIVGVWAGAQVNSWWLVLYDVTSVWQRRGIETLVKWYVSCPGGAITDATNLRLPFEYQEVSGNR